MAEQKVELRKVRDLSENLNDTILFIRQNFKPLLTSFLGIAGIFMLASAILNGLYQNRLSEVFREIFKSKDERAMTPVEVFNFNYFLVLISAWLNYVAIQVAVISYVKVYDVKNGGTPIINEVWDVFKKYFLRVFFYSIPIVLLTIGGTIFCLAPGIYFAVVFVPFSVVLMMEDESFGGAFNRCFTLVKDKFWISLLIYFLTWLIAFFSGSIIQIVVGSIAGIISYTTTKDISTTVAVTTSILNIFGFIFYIVYYISVCLHYFTLTEKYDGTGMMRKLESIGDNDQNFDNTQEQY